jgi:hypothetical protein
MLAMLELSIALALQIHKETDDICYKSNFLRVFSIDNFVASLLQYLPSFLVIARLFLKVLSSEMDPAKIRLIR